MRRPNPMNFVSEGREFMLFPLDASSVVGEDGRENTPKQRLWSKKARMTSSGRGVAQYISLVEKAALTSETERRDELVVMR